MSETGDPARPAGWRRVVGEVALALDLVPGGLAVVLGLVLGAAVLGAAVAGGWGWLASIGVGIAVLLGRSAGMRPAAAGWGRPVVGAAALVGIAGGLVGLAIVRTEPGEAGPSVVARADGVEAMRLDLGGGGSTGGDESTDGSSGSSDTTAAQATSTGSSSSGGDETTGGPAPKKPPRRRRPVVEPQPEPDDTTGGAVVADVPAVEPEPGSCPSGMVLITGVDDESFDGHHIEPFCLDVTEVKVSSYERCMGDGKCSEAGKESGFPPDFEYSKDDYCNRNHEGRGSHPINCVDWEQAKDFCAWAGKRLPTQWEWEWAARGRDKGWTYPWGEEEPTCERAVMSQGGDGCGKDRTWHVGSKPKGNSRDGVKDMAGNVWEWTSSKDGESRIVRGGSWLLHNPGLFRASYRAYFHPSSRLSRVGFRCARTAGGTK